MSYPAFANLYRWNTDQSLALASAAGAAVSCVAFGTETYAVHVSFAGSASSTGGVLLRVIDAAGTAVDSTKGGLIPSQSPVAEIKVSPGQKISAISADAGTPTLRIVELTK